MAEGGEGFEEFFDFLGGGAAEKEAGDVFGIYGATGFAEGLSQQPHLIRQGFGPFPFRFRGLSDGRSRSGHLQIALRGRCYGQGSHLNI